MSQGWVSVHRKIQSHWLWEDRPFSKGQAWVDIILLANHEDSKFLLGSQLLQVQRGEVVTSEIKLMGRWGWSKSKVRAFLELLENDSMIVKKTDRKKTTITIRNYCVWQDSRTTKEPMENHQETTKRLPKDTINNVNNVNKDIYTIFDFWNSKEIVKHRKLVDAMKSSINARLNDGYKVSDIIEAIDNYHTALTSDDYYWTYKWTLGEFIKPKNLDRFLTENEPLSNFRKKETEAVGHIAPMKRQKTADEIKVEEFLRRIEAG